MKRFRGIAMSAAMALAMAGTVTLTGCGKQETAGIPELIGAVGIDMDKTEVIRMDLSGIISYAAQIVPDIEDLSFPASGNIGDMKVSVGDRVKKGQLLATLSGNPERAKRLREEIKNRQAENDDLNEQSRYEIDMLEEGLKELRKQKKAAKQPEEKKQLRRQIVESEENIKIAEEKLRQQKELQQLEIRQKRRELSELDVEVKSSKLYSPVSGEIVMTAGGSGYKVQGGNTVIRVANMEAPRLRTAYISGAKLAKAGRYVAVVGGMEYRIQAEEQEVDRRDAEMGVFPSNTWFDFETGQKVEAEVGDSATLNLYTDSVEDALVVPSNAVFGGDGGSYVYLVEGDAKTKVPVTTGTKTDAYVQIKTGVKEGDVVYVEN